MSRNILPEHQIDSAIRDAVASHHAEVIQQAQEAIAQHEWVVIGMASNPYVKRARKALADAGHAHHYLEFGSYFSQWRRRNALKMWTGWPTFPMVFHRGVLIGGANDLERWLKLPQASKPQ